MATAARRLRELLEAQPPDAAAIRAFLDGLSHAERLEAIRALGGAGVQRRLWEAAKDAPRVTLDQLVPRDAGPLREVIWHGKNSLPAFTRFQKRFCRPARGDGTLWGYNEQRLVRVVGPGYFVVHEDATRGAAIDYREVPPQGAPGWPPVTPNDAGLSYFVYRDMVDYLRRVSAHVLIGRATKHGKDLENYFVLCREP
ncbi:MAG: hypothetical protein U0807_05700 [Candidatus Binatia bacterium]